MNRFSFQSRISTTARYLLLFLACLPGSPLMADGQAGVDAVLLMDSSGSMAKNDPKKLRVPAAKMFMSLLGERDRVGLISFSDNGYPVLHLTAPTPANSSRILASADRVSSKGVYTNLHAALVKGIAMLDKEGRPGQEKMLILMSDGKMDVGDADEDWKLRQQVQGGILQQLKDKRIKVYAIAFTAASDTELLKEIADGTGAIFRLAYTDEDLHKVFAAIFESAKDPDMLPIEGGEFAVDSSIEEVTIVASKEREDVRVYLQTPDGKKLGSDDADDRLKWFLSHHFDMITISNPQPGRWKLLSTAGNNRAYIVTNMALNHSPQEPRLKVNQDMVLEVWLEEDGELLDREAVLTNTAFEIEVEDPNGAKARFSLFDRGEYGDRKAADGIYSNTLAYENPGSYRLSMLARGATFQRQKTVYFDVAPPPEAAADTPETPEPPAEPEPAPVPEPEQAEPAPAQEPEQQAGPEPAAEAQDEEAEPAVEPKPKKKGVNLVMAIGIFVGVNLLLAALGGGIWWFLKKRKKPADGEDDEDQDAEDEA